KIDVGRAVAVGLRVIGAQHPIDRTLAHSDASPSDRFVGAAVTPVVELVLPISPEPGLGACNTDRGVIADRHVHDAGDLVAVAGADLAGDFGSTLLQLGLGGVE